MIKYLITNEIKPIGPKDTKVVKPEIKMDPEITLVIQFLHLGGSLANALSAKSNTVCGIRGSGSAKSSSRMSSSHAESVSWPCKASAWLYRDKDNLLHIVTFIFIIDLYSPDWSLHSNQGHRQGHSRQGGCCFVCDHLLYQQWRPQFYFWHHQPCLLL